jgi:hypothetical protein
MVKRRFLVYAALLIGGTVLVSLLWLVPLVRDNYLLQGLAYTVVGGAILAIGRHLTGWPARREPPTAQRSGIPKPDGPA